MTGAAAGESVKVIGRYTLHAEIASGGMATIHVGRLNGPAGFGRTVAIKRLHAMYAKDPEFVAMFLDEARLAARIQHPNVVSVEDVVAERGELLLVMDYIHGESLARLLWSGRIEPAKAVKIMTDVLAGLHAAHEAKSERGTSLGIVHRDVSPQNILVACDGVARLVDFGIAKAGERIQHTRDGQLKGKLRYMPPEQVAHGSVDRRTDIYAAAAVLWEALVGRQLFTKTGANLMYAVLKAEIPLPRTLVPDIPQEVEAVVMKALAKDPSQRFSTALEMSDALEAALTPATSREVGRWVEGLTGRILQERAELVAEVESQFHLSVPPAALFSLTQPDSDAGTSRPAAALASPDRGKLAAAEGAAQDATVIDRARTRGPGAQPDPGDASAVHLATESSLRVDAGVATSWRSRVRRWVPFAGGAAALAAVAIWSLYGPVAGSSSAARPSASLAAKTPAEPSSQSRASLAPAAGSASAEIAGEQWAAKPPSASTSSPAMASATRPARPVASAAISKGQPPAAPPVGRKTVAPPAQSRGKAIYIRD